MTNTNNAVAGARSGGVSAGQFDQAEAARLHAAGFKLCKLEHLRKRPEGINWNGGPVAKVDATASGYGIILAPNGLCSIDPDQLDLATIALRAVGFDLNEVMAQGVRTTSTRPGSGGRSAFKASPSLKWFSFAVKLNGSKESTAVFELRAGSANLQDCCPGVRYQTTRRINGKDVVTNEGAIYGQEYANGKTFLEAPELPFDLADFWEKMSDDPAFRREAEIKMVEALRDAGHDAAPVFNLRFSGKKLAIEINPQLRAKFNAAVSVESILTKHGYSAPSRKGGRWASPGSTGAPSIRLIPGHESLWQSDHQSDPLNGTFDAAQASVVLDHDYDVEAFEEWCHARLQGLKHREATATFGGEPEHCYSALEADPAGADDESEKEGASEMFASVDLSNISRTELTTAKLTPRVILEQLLYADLRARVAAGGVGKTTLALYEAARLALGLDVWGRTPDGPKRTIFFSREDQRSILVARLREIMKCMFLTTEQEDQVLHNVRIIDLSGVGIRLSVISGDVVMPNTPVLNWIIAITKEWSPDWLVFDPLVSFGVGESRVNDAEQGLVEAFRVLRNKLDACIEGIHHTGKANAREKTSDQYSSRGGTALPDGCRMVAVLNPADAEEWLQETGTPLNDGEDGIMMALPKLSYCAKQETVFIRRKGYSFSMAARVNLSPEDIRRGDAEKVFNFIAKEYSEGRRYSKADLDLATESIQLSRAKIRAAASFLKMNARVKYNEVDGQAGSHYEPLFIDFDNDENGGGRRTPQKNDTGMGCAG